MKRTNLAKKLTAMAMTGVMVMSMGMTAFAAEAPTEFDFTKEITTDGNTVAPAVKFTFDVTPGANSDSGVSPVVTAGPAGGLSAGDVVFTGSETADDDGTYSGIGKLNVNMDAFDGLAPGIYSYVLSEKDFEEPTTGKNPYEGIDKDPTKYTLYVYMTDDNLDGELEYKGVTTAVLDEDDEVDVKVPSLTFTNDYGKDNDGTHDLTIKKLVAGNQGDKTHPFSFSVRIDGAAGEKYKFVYGDTTGVIASEETKEFTLAHDDTFVIYGLSENDAYTITEKDNEGDLTGYVTTVSRNDVISESAMGGEGVLEQIGTVSADAATVDYTNSKNVTTPTGIAMTFAPYAVMVVFAGVFAVMFLRKKREDF